MILAWLVVVVVASIIAWRHRHEPGGHGWRWSLAWLVAGLLWSLSLVTGFSIGLVILPLAAVVLICVALRSPHLPEAVGFIAGIGATALIVVALAA